MTLKKLLSSMIVCLGLAAIAACSKMPEQDALTATTAEFVKAYNADDLDGMMALVHANVRWLSIDGASINIETEGRDALEAAMAAYFASGPRSPSQMRFMRREGDYVIGVEEIMRNQAGQGGNRCSVVVYRFADTLIKDVWYHQAYAC